MEVGTISMRYAKALMGYAQDRKQEEALYEDFLVLMRSFKALPDMRKVLDNPIVSIEDKYELLRIAVSDKRKPTDEFLNFVRLVLSNKRGAYLLVMGLMYIDLYRKKKHIAIARLTTAVPVSKDMEDKIRKISSMVLHAKMELRTTVDPAIEGGFVFDINDYRLDASIATQLKRVKQQFIDKNRRIV